MKTMLGPYALRLTRGSLAAFVVIAACGGRVSGISGSGSNVAVSGGTSTGTPSGGSGTVSVVASGMSSGALISGSVGASGTVARSGTLTTSTGGASESGSMARTGTTTATALPHGPSAGCGLMPPATAGAGPTMLKLQRITIASCGTGPITPNCVSPDFSPGGVGYLTQAEIRCAATSA